MFPIFIFTILSSLIDRVVCFQNKVVEIEMLCSFTANTYLFSLIVGVEIALKNSKFWTEYRFSYLFSHYWRTVEIKVASRILHMMMVECNSLNITKNRMPITYSPFQSFKWGKILLTLLSSNVTKILWIFGQHK